MTITVLRPYRRFARATLGGGGASLGLASLHLIAERWWLAAAFLLIGLVQVVSALRLLRHRVEVSDRGLLIATDDQTDPLPGPRWSASWAASARTGGGTSHCTFTTALKWICPCSATATTPW